MGSILSDAAKHITDITVLYDADQQATLTDSIYAAKHATAKSLKLWRNHFPAKDVIRKSYEETPAPHEKIVLRSGAPGHVSLVHTFASGSVSYDFNASHGDISVVHTSERGRNTLVVDDVTNYSNLSRLLYICHMRELRTASPGSAP